MTRHSVISLLVCLWYSAAAAASILAVTTRAHNGLNQITGISGGGKTLIRGTLDEPGNVAVGRTGMGDRPARMTSDTTFEAELELPAGTNSITVTAQDPSGNKRTNTYLVQTASQSARTFAYDYDGNLESDGERSYEWDSQSRLTKVTWATGVTTTFVYNGLSQLSTRIDSDGTNTDTRHYLFAGISLVDRRTGTEPDPDTAAIDRRYYPQGEQRFDGTAWTTYYYCRDHLGSVREVVKSDATLAARYDYDPYGKRLIQYQSTAYAAGGSCDLGFTGHITQPSLVAGQTELTLAHFRAYDSSLGRWISTDMVGEFGPDGSNRYTYVRGTPLSLIDPNGLWGIQIYGFMIGSGDPTLVYDAEVASHTWEDLNKGAAAAIDGAIPFADPYADAGYYDPKDGDVGFSKECGGIVRDAAITATGVGIASKGASVLAKMPWIGRASALFGRKKYGTKGVLNCNDYVRMGWGWNNNTKKDVFRIACGSTPKWAKGKVKTVIDYLRHIDIL